MAAIIAPPSTVSIFQYPPNFPAGVVNSQWITWFNTVQANTFVFPAAAAGYAIGWDALGNLVNVPNTGADQTAVLADTTLATNGAGRIGYNGALSYAAGTLGNQVSANVTAIASRLVAADAANLTDATKGAGRIGYNGALSYATGTVGNQVSANVTAIVARLVAADASTYLDQNKGAALIGFNPALTYPGPSVGSRLNDLATASFNTGASLIGYLAPYTGAVPRTQASKNKDCISVTDFGAVGDWNQTTGTDNSPAFQAAVNAAAAFNTPGASVVYIPAGEYKLLTTITVPNGVSLVGAGPAYTRIYPRTVNGFLLMRNYGNLPYYFGQKISGFTIYGSALPGATSTSQIGIKYEALGVNDQVRGLQLENVYFANLTPFYFNGLWYSVIKDCYGSSLNGPVLAGENVQVLMDGCHWVCSQDPITVSTPYTGVSVYPAPTPVGGSAACSQDIQIRNTGVYGFAVGMWVQDILYGGIHNCDIDNCQSVGLYLGSSTANQGLRGGFTVSGNWILTKYNSNFASYTFTDGATVNTWAGIQVVAPSTNNTEGVTYRDNRIAFVDVGGPHTSWGIRVGGNQFGHLLEGNRISGFTYGMYLDGQGSASHYAKVIGNTFIGSITCDLFTFGTAGNYIAGNYFSGPSSIFRNNPQNGSNLYGENQNYLTSGAGKFATTGGSTTGTVTLASCNLPNGNTSDNNGTYVVNVMERFNNHGTLKGICDGTNVTWYGSIAYGSADTLYFTVQLIDN